jgi:hypothetical protein
VLFLDYRTEQEFWRVAKSRELREGIVTPHEPEDVERVRTKKSAYAGMREEDFIDAIEKLLAEQKDSPGYGRE